MAIPESRSGALDQRLALDVQSVDALRYTVRTSPEEGLKVYRAGDFNDMVCHAISHELLHWQDTHFRPDPAHMVFVAC